jgi:hypothetical protein
VARPKILQIQKIRKLQKKQQLKISGVYQPNSIHFRVAKLRHVRRHLMGSPSSEAQVDSVQAWPIQLLIFLKRGI